MNDLRLKIIGHISDRKEIWTKILISTYVLTQMDRIGRRGINERKGVPGLWGHSYIRTYYNWVGTPPNNTVQMEGGIATSYFVLKSLNSYLNRFGTKLDKNISKDLSDFFINRTKYSGIGVQTTGSRGTSEVATNLRHTCFGYLTMREIESSDVNKVELDEAIKTAAAVIIRPLSQEELLDKLINESWPIGGIASYITARDHIFNSPYNVKWSQSERNVWPGVRKRLLDALIDIDSKQLGVVSLILGSKGHEDRIPFTEHFPFWHPIYDLNILRLHSTIGCLSLIGREMGTLPSGRSRIEEIINNIRQQILGSTDKIPRFDPIIASPPSFAAACAMTEIVLGTWYEPTPKDSELIFSLLKFLEDNWDNPSVYTDYWTEFTAPLLNLEELHRGLGNKHANLAYQESTTILDKLNEVSDLQDTESWKAKDNLLDMKALFNISPVALGNQLI